MPFLDRQFTARVDLALEASEESMSGRGCVRGLVAEAGMQGVCGEACPKDPLGWRHGHVAHRLKLQQWVGVSFRAATAPGVVVMRYDPWQPWPSAAV